MNKYFQALALSLTTLLLAGCATTARPSDPDTRSWWDTTKLLSSDEMEGRDTGSRGYDRAAQVVADRFRASGLLPAGDNGSYFQPIRLHEVRVDKAGTSFAVARSDGTTQPLRFLHQISIRPGETLPRSIDAPLTFRGYCSPAEMKDIAGKMVVCFAARRAGQTSASDRSKAALAGNAAGLISVDDPYFTIEPPRWPIAYARTVTFADAAAAPGPELPAIRLNADALAPLIAGSGQDASALLRAGGSGAPLPSFDVKARFRATLNVQTADYRSSNVLAVLPGSDPALKNEYVVVGAHLDGYGFGEPIDGDGLYNGTFDDAAYVALLIRLAERQKGRGFRRSVLFAAFTGEEKGLLGSYYLARNPVVPLKDMAAMINLDQLRPLFPLDLMTVHAVDDTTLGQHVRAVAGPMGIAIQNDPEPERNLLQRTDHWPFLQKGVPAVNFVFGYRPGTDAERRYRLWYQTRYHHPGDDPLQPKDFEAAAKFNSFFYQLVERVGNADARPAWSAQSPYRPK